MKKLQLLLTAVLFSGVLLAQKNELSIDYSDGQFSYWNGETVIKSLPEDLTSIVEVNVYDDRLTELPKEIGQMTNLKVLNVGNYDDIIVPNMSISEFPVFLKNLTKLEELVFANQTITEIPFDISVYSSLRKLDLSGNELTQVPKGIGEVPLEELHLDMNRIKELPKELNNLSSTLLEFDISENDIESLGNWDPSSFDDLSVSITGCPLSFAGVKELVQSVDDVQMVGVPSVYSIPDPSHYFDKTIWESSYLCDFEEENPNDPGVKAFQHHHQPYSYIYTLWDTDYYVVRRGLYHAIFDKSGNEIIPFERRRLGPVAGGKLSFVSQESGKCGYMDLNGNVVIEAIFDDGEPFKEGRALVRFEYGIFPAGWEDYCGFNDCGYINENGERINKEPLCYGLDGSQFTMIYFSEFKRTEVAVDLCAETDDYPEIKYQVINSNGNVVYPNETYTDHAFFHEQTQVALQNKDGKWGIIDQVSDEEVYPFIADKIMGVSDGGGQGHFINADKYVIVGVENGDDKWGNTTYLYGITDLSGQWVLEPAYEYISGFESEEEIFVSQNEEYFSINIQGERITD